MNTFVNFCVSLKSTRQLQSILRKLKKTPSTQMNYQVAKEEFCAKGESEEDDAKRSVSDENLHNSRG